MLTFDECLQNLLPLGFIIFYHYEFIENLNHYYCWLLLFRNLHNSVYVSICVCAKVIIVKENERNDES